MSTEWLSALKTLDHVTVKAIKDNTSRISYRVGLPAPTLLLMIEFASAALPVVLLIMWAIDAAIYQITPEFNLGLVFNLVGLMAIMAIGATINLLFATILQSIHYWVEYEEASKTPRFSGMS